MMEDMVNEVARRVARRLNELKSPSNILLQQLNRGFRCKRSFGFSWVDSSI